MAAILLPLRRNPISNRAVAAGRFLTEFNFRPAQQKRSARRFASGAPALGFGDNDRLEGVFSTATPGLRRVSPLQEQRKVFQAFLALPALSEGPLLGGLHLAGRCCSRKGTEQCPQRRRESFRRGGLLAMFSLPQTPPRTRSREWLRAAQRSQRRAARFSLSPS
jgi:hypothetical protein